MKLGVLTVPLYDRPLADALAYLANLGVQCVELGCGGSPGKTHLNPADAFADADYVPRLQDLLQRHGMTISALSCHGNPVHPNSDAAARDHADFVDACKLAQMLGVDTVVTFSGAPGGGPDAQHPNWVTCVWPTDYANILKYQWENVLVPYWKNAVDIAQNYGVTKIALEMHPGFAVYNPRSLLRLREAAGPAIGANFDPSHLFWQGIDPVQALKALKGAVYHFHAKDTFVDAYNTAVNGVLDLSPYNDLSGRSWLFRTVGFGHGEDVWRGIISALRTIGYDGALSIEHEDGLMSIEEGLEKATGFLQPMIMREAPGDMWWL